MREKILEIIIELTECEDLKDNQNIDLIENEILDSLSFIELINELNDAFDIEIQPTRVSIDTWRNIDGILELVEKLVEKNEI